jgi:hypothetical protein
MPRPLVSVLLALCLPVAFPVPARADWLPWNGQPMADGTRFSFMARTRCAGPSADGGQAKLCGSGTETLTPAWVEVAQDGYLTVGRTAMSPPDEAIFTASVTPGSRDCSPFTMTGVRGPVHLEKSPDGSITALRSGGAGDSFSLGSGEGATRIFRNLTRPEDKGPGCENPLAIGAAATSLLPSGAVHRMGGGARTILAGIEGAAEEPIGDFSVYVEGGHLRMTTSFGTISGVGPDCDSSCVSPVQYPGQPITLKASTSAGYHLASWGGVCTGQKDATCTLPTGIRGDVDVSASFSNQYKLTVQVEGSSSGEVLVVDGRCTAAKPCTLPFVGGLTVPVMNLQPHEVVVWTPSTGQSCQRNESCNVTMNGDVTLKVRFTGKSCPPIGDCPSGH